ncbi:hypothetical protein CRENBAI_021099 [Crenichthys baileyi]|uniref:Uncharacterized protein n=1 Tax=Crenichthys baileyi TaxID=28760 RepID=A0AAV9S3F8_9TELE
MHGENMQTPCRKTPEPRTILLQGNSATNCATVQPLLQELKLNCMHGESHRKDSWISSSVSFLCLCSVLANPSRSWQMAAHTEPGSAGGFFLLKGRFFLSTVATCMLSMRDCCKVNASDCPLFLHAHPGGVNAASH